MKRAIKKQSGLYAFLEPYLAQGSEEAIAKARKAYWKEYRAKWRKNKRKVEQVFAVSFTKSELHIINKAARTHKRSRTRFIKEAVMAYINQQYLVPDVVTVHEIKELLVVAYTHIHKLSEERLVPEVMGKYLLLKILEMEKAVTEKLNNPKTVTGDH